MGRRDNKQTAEQAVERARFAVREVTGSKVSSQHHFDRIQQLRDIGADELADAREQGWGLS
ncbi:MAG: hypothetical protein J2P20_15245 [Pseudonocardia sp.]|nr:hypothetical protein [Pseudonocardia sp.]MBO0877979.1 hypothetical protein [Pseudonocardia sp.]